MSEEQSRSRVAAEREALVNLYEKYLSPVRRVQSQVSEAEMQLCGSSASGVEEPGDLLTEIGLEPVSPPPPPRASTPSAEGR
jgi:hypothetical protein